MNITHIGKIEEGLYSVSSLACPVCKDTLTLELPGDKLFLYHQGAHIQQVMPDISDDERERFISGYCPSCWIEMFGDDDDDEEY